MRDKRSYVLSPGYEDEKSHKGLFIDIFPADRYHKTSLIFRAEKIIKTYNAFICKSLDSVDFKDKSFLRKFLAYFHPVFNFLVKEYMKFAKKLINRNKKLGNDCYIGHGFDTLWRRYFSYDDIYPFVELEFEGHKFYAPHSYRLYLKTLYGDNYMTPIHESERTQHAKVIRPIL